MSNKDMRKELDAYKTSQAINRVLDKMAVPLLVFAVFYYLMDYINTNFILSLWK